MVAFTRFGRRAKPPLDRDQAVVPLTERPSCNTAPPVTGNTSATEDGLPGNTAVPYAGNALPIPDDTAVPEDSNVPPISDTNPTPDDSNTLPRPGNAAAADEDVGTSSRDEPGAQEPTDG